MQIVTGKKKTFKTVISRSGAGKTVLCYFLIKAQNKPSVIFDTAEQFDDEMILTFEDFVNAFNNQDFRESFYKYDKTIILRAKEKDINSFFSLVMKSSKFHDLLIFIDEIDLALQSSRVNNDSGFYEFLNRGRHKNLDLITTCRNTANIPKPLIAQTDFFYFSDLIEKGAISFVDDTLKGMSVAEDLETLEPYQFLVVDVNNKDKWTLKPDIKWLELFQHKGGELK